MTPSGASTSLPASPSTGRRATALAVTLAALASLYALRVRAEPALPAFPGAEGFGSTTPGGRGGRVILVTNLRDSGPGSLRAALEATGRRIVVFRVSGTITLDRDIKVTSPYLTVLGQTAPGGGITLRSNRSTNPSGLMDIHAHDVVIRFLRFRSGTYNGTNQGNPITVWKEGAWNVVLDHNSFSWGVNENVTTYSFAHDVTISWNIISEALNNAGHPLGPHSRGLFMSGQGATRNQSAHHNLIVSNDRRNPEVDLTGTADVVNNVVYNWGTKAGLVSDKYLGFPLNFVGNYYKPGPSSSGSYGLEIYHRGGVCYGTLQIYLHGNISPSRPDDSLPEDRVMKPDPCVTLLSTPNPAPPVRTTSARQAFAEVLERAGAVFPYRDEVDRRVVADVLAGTGRIIDDPSEVGGWPALPKGTPPPDADRDGMPDDWEVARGLDPTRDDSAGDRDGDGYTNVEEYANELVAFLVPGGPGSADRAGGPSPADRTRAAGSACSDGATPSP